MAQTQSRSFSVKDLVYIAVCAALITVCSWITIPLTVPFTMQTFAVFLTVSLLGGKRGTLAILVYVLMAAVGLPVLSGFKGGIGALLGTTGGYVLGFIASALIMWLFEKYAGKSKWITALSMLIGLIACYALGTAWFMIVYTRSNGAVTLAATLGWCVIPFIIPDLCKIALALFLRNRLIRYI